MRKLRVIALSLIIILGVMSVADINIALRDEYKNARC